jgi:phasin family protein
MSFNTQDFSAPAKAQLDVAIRAATIASDSAAKLFELNTKTARAAFEEFTGAIKAAASVKDPAELRTLASKAAQPDLEKAQAYARTVYEHLAATQAELASLVESQVTEFNKQVVVAMDSVLKSAPAGSEAFVSAVKTAMTTANQAYETSVQSLKDAGSSMLGAAPVTGSKRKAA